MDDGTRRASDSVEGAIRLYSDMVYKLAFARTRTRADADDVYQEVFLKLVKRGEAFESEEHRKAWLLRATACESVNFLKSAWRRRTVPLLREPEQAEAEADEGLALALTSLKPKTRTAIHLFYYERMSAEEIGAILGERASSVRSRLARGRAKLRKLLEEEEGTIHVGRTIP